MSLKRMKQAKNLEFEEGTTCGYNDAKIGIYSRFTPSAGKNGVSYWHSKFAEGYGYGYSNYKDGYCDEAEEARNRFLVEKWPHSVPFTEEQYQQFKESQKK